MGWGQRIDIGQGREVLPPGRDDEGHVCCVGAVLQTSVSPAIELPGGLADANNLQLYHLLPIREGMSTSLLLTCRCLRVIGSYLAAFQRRACSTKIPHGRRTMHCLQAMWSGMSRESYKSSFSLTHYLDLPRSSNHNRSRGTWRWKQTNNPLWYRHDQVHLLWVLSRELPCRCHCRVTECRIRYWN